MHICVGVFMCHSACVEIIGQCLGVSSFLPSYGFQDSNPGQAWWQVPFPNEPSCWPQNLSDSNVFLECVLGIGGNWVLRALRAWSTKMLSFLFVFKIYLFSYVGEFCLHVCLHMACVLGACLWRSEGVRSSRTGSSDSHVHAEKQSVSFGRMSHRCSQQLSSSPRINSFSLFKDLFIFLFFCIVSVCLYEYHMCAMISTGTRKGHQIPWNGGWN